MDQGRRRLRWAALAMVGLAVSGMAVLAPAWGQSPDAPVFIPGFWDPNAVPPKPDLRGLTAIRFITADDYPPFDFITPDGTLKGFNVDLARALCAELQVTCTIQPRAWSTVVPALKGGGGDAAIASIAISDALRREVDFTAPYYKTPARFVVRATSGLTDPTPSTLAGQRVGVVAGTAHAAYLAAFFPTSMIKTFPTPAAARDALRAGDLDAIFTDGIGAALWLNGTEAAGCCRFAGGPYTDSRYFGRGSGIATRLGDVTLRQALDYALARVAQKGIYGDLYLKYFPIGFY